MRCSRASRARQAAPPSALLSTSGVVSGVDVCRIASHPWPLPVSRNRLDPCFQRALGDLSLFFCLFFFCLNLLSVGFGKSDKECEKIWCWKTILIRRRSAGTEAGVEELFSALPVVIGRNTQSGFY